MIQVNFYSKSEATFLNTKLHVVFLTSIDYLFGSRIHLQIRTSRLWASSPGRVFSNVGRVVSSVGRVVLSVGRVVWGELSWGQVV